MCISSSTYRNRLVTVYNNLPDFSYIPLADSGPPHHPPSERRPEADVMKRPLEGGRGGEARQESRAGPGKASICPLLPSPDGRLTPG